jgi:F0F1-type ATP synthase beta subunit
MPVHLERVTVTDLLHELEACQPDAEVRTVQQPAWPFEDAIDPANAAVQTHLDATSVVDLGQSAQLGYPSPEPVRHQLGS